MNQLFPLDSHDPLIFGSVPDFNAAKALGMHVIVEYYGCNPQKMSDIEAVKEAFLTAAKEANCTVVTECFHGFEPHGVSGVVVISESHFTYHGWDEHNYAAVDFFYCGDQVQIQKAIDYIGEFLDSSQRQIYTLRRGLIQ